MAQVLTIKKNILLSIKSLRIVFGELTISPVYESEAVGFKGENFYNLVISFESNLTARKIIEALKSIEIQQGRPGKTTKFSPRCIDLDLLLHDQLIDSGIDLPRAEILTNAFVLQPLSNIAGKLIHPIVNESYQILWSKFPKSHQKLWQIDTIIN